LTAPRQAKKQPRILPENKGVDITKATSSTHKPTSTKPEFQTKIDLLVLRHGEAGNRMRVVEEDSERPLTPEGRIEMQKIARSLKAVGLQSDRIFTSPLRRARETAEIAAKTLKIPIFEEWDELKPDGNKTALYRKLARLGQNSRVILVGHEPYLSSMMGEIVGATGIRIVLKKGGLGKVRITSFSPRISGELRWLLTPKMIAKMS
jgi:phosphohistidine phosphatase